MLILTRRIGESLIMAKKIKVTVLGLTQDQEARIKVTANHEDLCEKISIKIGESHKIQSDITMTILSIKGRQVRLGVAAPKHIAVDREEIHERKQQGIPPPRGNFKQASTYHY